MQILVVLKLPYQGRVLLLEVFLLEVRLLLDELELLFLFELLFFHVVRLLYQQHQLLLLTHDVHLEIVINLIVETSLLPEVVDLIPEALVVG